MHILFLTDNFPPEVNAPATRTAEHILEWEKKGAKITVITCAPNFPKGVIFKGYKNKFHSKEQWSDNISVIRVWTYIAKNKGFLKRTIDYFSFAVSSFFAGLFVKKPDIIIATSPQFFTVWSGFALSKMKKIPWIFELRDLWPQSIVTVGAFKSPRIIRFLEKIELFLYKKSSAVVSVTDSFVENLVSRGIDKNKIFVVKNGVNRERFAPREKNKELVEKYKLEGFTTVGYVGTMGMAHNLFFILKSAMTLENYKFLFIGDGARREYLLKMKEQLGLKNVIFTGMISKKEIREYISILDIALVNLKKSEDFKKVIPSKIFELTSMQKPILLGVEGEAKKIIEKYEAGICFEPENEEDFVKKLKLLSEDKKLYDKIKNNTQNLAKDFDRKILAEKMFNIIKKIAEENNGI